MTTYSTDEEKIGVIVIGGILVILAITALFSTIYTVQTGQEEKELESQWDGCNNSI